MTALVARGRTSTLFLWIGVGPLRDAAGRSLIAALAIALGIALGFGIYLVNRSAADEVVTATRALFGEADLVVQGSAQGFSEALYPMVARVPGVAHVSPVLEVVARLPDHSASLNLLGLDPFRARYFEPALTDGVPNSTSSDSFAADGVLLSTAAARALGFAKDDVFTVQVGLEKVQLHVAALLPTLNRRDAMGVMDIAAAQWRLHRLGNLTRLDIKVTDSRRTATVRDAIARVLPAGMRVTTPNLQSDEALRISRAYRANLSALALVALFTGAFLVYSTQSLAVMRRRRELALLHAIGLSRREEVALILAGAAAVGAVGSALGTVLGALAAELGLRALGGDLGAGYFNSIDALNVHWFEWLSFFALGIVVAVLSAITPAIEAYRIAPAFALKSGDVAESNVRTHGSIGLLCLIVGGLLLLVPPIHGLPLPGYVSIAVLLIGTVFLLPLGTRLLFSYLPTPRSAVLQIVVAHLRGTKRFVTTSIASILVSFSLMVAMAIMVTSFRTSLDQWMGRLLQADIYVRAGTARESAFMDPAHIAALRTIPGVVRVDPIRSTSLLLGPALEPIALAARPIDLSRPDRDLWLISQTSLPTPQGMTPIWISEASMDLNHLKQGSELALPVNGRSVRGFIRGVWRDYEHQGGAIVMDYSAYVQISGDERVDGVRLWLAGAANKDAVLEEVHRRLPSGAAYDLRFPMEIRALALRAFDRTFAVTYILEALAVLIGLFGIGATSSAQVLARRAEFGMLRCLGLTRRQIGSMLAFEGASLGILGVVSGLLLGWLISFILVYVINRQSFHWSMDVYIPRVTLLILSLVLVAAAAVTAVLSGRQAMSEDVVKAVKEDW